MPETFTGLFAGFDQLSNQSFVVAQNGGGMVSQGDDAGAGQGCQVDDHPGIEPLGIGEGVSQDQAAFGVGI